jgi:putative endonuclease
MNNLKPYFVYILECADDSLYTGITDDVQRRLRVHESGKGSKYVWARLPFKLVYSEQVASRSLALKREYEIKQLSRKQKLRLFNPDLHYETLGL